MGWLRASLLGVITATGALAACNDLYLVDFHRVYPDAAPSGGAPSAEAGPAPSGGGNAGSAHGAGGTRDGGGGSAPVNVPVPCGDAGDCPAPPPCNKAVCEQDTCSTAPLKRGSACGTTGKELCDGDGRCTDVCGDGIQDGRETDVDCGGPCSPCESGKACSVAGDCRQHLCVLTPSNPPAYRCSDTCNTDGVQNGGEGGIDCGEACSRRCPLGRSCTTNGDCASRFCVDGICCGTACSGTCQQCEPSTGACIELSPAALAPRCPSSGERCTSDGVCGTCADGKLEADLGETGVDCGGGVCSRCAAGVTCVASSDCASCLCEKNECQQPRCNNHKKDGCESDVDCGGVCGPCGLSQACSSKTDCASASCRAGKCVRP